MRSPDRSPQRTDDAYSGQAQIHVPVQAGRRDGGSQGGRELIGAQGHMGRDAREEIGRKGNQSASTTNRIYKAGQKYQWADNEQHGDFHDSTSFFQSVLVQ